MDFDAPSPPLFRSEDLEAMHIRMLRRPPRYAAATMTSSELSEYIRHQRMFLQDHLINWEQVSGIQSIVLYLRRPAPISDPGSMSARL